MKKVYTAIILIVLLCGGVLSANYIFLQRHMNEVLKEDPRNDGISVWVYYKWFVNSSEINYDLRSVSAENSSLDVSRVMLQFAEKVKDYDFSKVYLSYR
ncbi:YdgA family protein, partial [Klebsiella pneumoniae]